VTPTEEFLCSTLAAEAAAIRRESLRPLDAPAYGKGRSRTARWGGRGYRPLAAVAAAASVLIVIGLALLARSMVTSAPPFADVGTTTSPPPYYVEIDNNDRILVQSTATGRRTDMVIPPLWVHPNSNGDAALTTSADGRTFVAAYNDWNSLRTNLFRFTLTSSGQVAGFTRIRTARLPGLSEPSLAISPDETQVALAGIPDLDRSLRRSPGPPLLLVLDLRTGHVRTWPGLAGTGEADRIEDPAWVTDGSLRFLVATCRGYRDSPDNAACAYSGPAGREWALNVPPGAAPLGPGRALVRLPGVTVQALSGPGVDSVTALELLQSAEIRVARYDGSDGRLLKTLYSGVGHLNSNVGYAGLAADGSGRYVLINEELGSFFGWTGDGRFHKLLIHGPYGSGDEIVAAAW
jgi:hypothetical protein